MMTKKDLMTGDIVVERNGELAVVIKTEKEEYLMYQTGGYDFLDDYNDDLTYVYPDNKVEMTDIMQVYRAAHGAISFFDYEDEEPIYERDYSWTKPAK